MWCETAMSECQPPTRQEMSDQVHFKARHDSVVIPFGCNEFKVDHGLVGHGSVEVQKQDTSLSWSMRNARGLRCLKEINGRRSLHSRKGVHFPCFPT